MYGCLSLFLSLGGDESLPACSVTGASPCPGAALPDVHLLEVSAEVPAEVSLLLLLLGKDLKAPAKTSLGVPFTNPGTKPLVSPRTPAACRAVLAVPGCCACPQHSAVATTPNLSVLWFAGHLQFRPAKGLTS